MEIKIKSIQTATKTERLGSKLYQAVTEDEKDKIVQYILDKASKQSNSNIQKSIERIAKEIKNNEYN